MGDYAFSKAETPICITIVSPSGILQKDVVGTHRVRGMMVDVMKEIYSEQK